MSTPHQLKIVPTDDNRGFWLTSNGRTWFLDHEMLCDFVTATTDVWQNTVADVKKEWRNYEEPKSSPMPFQPLRSNSLDDLL